MNTSGTWEFFDITTPTEQNPTATVDWTADVDNKTAHLLLKNVDTRPDAEHAGDILSYDVGSEIASVIYTDASESEVWSIKWGTETGEGSLRVSEYNEGEKACRAAVGSTPSAPYNSIIAGGVSEPPGFFRDLGSIPAPSDN